MHNATPQSRIPRETAANSYPRFVTKFGSLSQATQARRTLNTALPTPTAIAERLYPPNSPIAAI